MTTFPVGWGGVAIWNENKANSVQLLLQLPTGTELGKIRIAEEFVEIKDQL